MIVRRFLMNGPINDVYVIKRRLITKPPSPQRSTHIPSGGTQRQTFSQPSSSNPPRGDEVTQAFKALQEQAKKLGGDNQLHIEPPEKGTVALNQWGTVTNDQVKNMPQPKYYDPNSGLALNTWGLFLAGMAQPINWIAKKMGKKDEELIQVDPTKLDTSGKIAYYTGRATFEAAAGYGTGEALGMAWGNLPKVGRVLSKVRGGKTIVKAATKVDDLFKGVSKTRPWVPKALSGTAKGMIVGTEAARGIMIKEHGGSWLDVAGTISSDFLGMYAFEKGITTGFSTARKNVVRKEFADKHSRLFIDQKPDIVKDEFGNVAVVRMKGPKEIPEGWPGAISTTPRPRKVTKIFTPKNPQVPFVKPPSKSMPVTTLDDEAKFLFGERNLPEALRTQEQLVQRGESVIKSGQQMLKTITGGKTTTAVKTITSVSRSRTAVQEAARVASMKRAFTSMTRIPHTIKDVSAFFGATALGITSNDLLSLPPKTQKQTDPYSSSGSNLGSSKNSVVNNVVTPGKNINTQSSSTNSYNHDPFRYDPFGGWRNWFRLDTQEKRSTHSFGSTNFNTGTDTQGSNPGNNTGNDTTNDWWQDTEGGTTTDQGKEITPNYTPDYIPDYTPTNDYNHQQDLFQPTDTTISFEVPSVTEVTSTIAGLTKYKPPTRVRRGKVPFVFPTGGSIFRGSGSAWWKKSGRKNKNKIFSFGPIKVDILPKLPKSSKRKARKKRRR